MPNPTVTVTRCSDYSQPKIAEAKILIQEKDKLQTEILKLEERREREIEKVYSESR